MICPNCSSLVNDDTNLCPECGTAIPQTDTSDNVSVQDFNSNDAYQDYPPLSENLSNQQYAPVDAGEKDASTSQICGIISLLLGPVFAVISLVFASKYKKTGNGQNIKKVKTGKICSWISITGCIIAFLLGFVALSEMHTFLSDNPELIEPQSSYNEDNDEPDDYINCPAGTHYSIEDNILVDGDEYMIMRYDMDIPSDGKVVYDENGIKVTLKNLYICQDNNSSPPLFKVRGLASVEHSDDITVDASMYLVNNAKVFGYSREEVNDVIFTINANFKSIAEIKDVAVRFAVIENDPAGKEYAFDIDVF